MFLITACGILSRPIGTENTMSPALAPSCACGIQGLQHAGNPARSRAALRLPHALLGVAFWVFAIAPVHAQASDPHIPVLINQIQALEGRVRTLEALVDDQLAMEQDVARLKLEAQQEKARLDLIEHNQFQLTADVQGLKDAQPAEPGKPAPNPANKPADGQPLTLRAPFIVKDAAGQVIFKVEVAAGRNQPHAIIGNPAGAHVEMGPAFGNSSAVGLYDSSNKLLSTLVADPKGSYLKVKDDDQSAILGFSEGDGRGLYLRHGAAMSASLFGDKSGAGMLKVFNANGKAVAGLYSDTDGGGLALTGSAGGKNVVSVVATASGGKVRVYPAGGGTTRAELVADGATGAVNVFGADASNAASLSSTASNSGRIEINSGGNIIMQAGATGKGLGFVSTGPYDGGIAGTMMGAGVGPASSLVGRASANK